MTVRQGLLAIAGFILVLPMTARAVQIVDQSYTVSVSGSVSTSVAGFNTHEELAQTFTVGVAGTLSSVDIFTRRYSGTTGNLLIDIRSVDGAGFPATTLLSKSIAPLDLFTFPHDVDFFNIDFGPSSIAVIPGEKLAIVMHSGAGSVTYQWVGDYAVFLGHDPYTGGAAYGGDSTNHTWGKLLGDDPTQATDFAFKAYVTPVPEPLSLGGFGVLAGVFLIRRRGR